jgi:hypothetical protein
MKNEEKLIRMVRLAAQERSEFITPFWFYLSFASPGHWNGGVIVLAHGFVTAILEAIRLHINPGGEITGHPVPSHHVPPLKYRNRLLTKEELEECWGPMVRTTVAEIEKLGVEKKVIDGDLFED